MEEIELGEVYTDTVTRFSGVATAHARYYRGNDSVLLEHLDPDSDKGIQTEWFDADRLERQT